MNIREILASSLARVRSRRSRVLIGIPVKNCAKYLENLGRQLVAIDYPKRLLDVALVVGDSIDDSLGEAGKLVRRLRSAGFRRVHCQQLRVGFELPHTSRHLEWAQARRWRALATSRQYVVDNFLADNDYVWWLDADFTLIPSTALARLLAYRRDVVIPVLRLPDGRLYDLRTRLGERTIDQLQGDELIRVDWVAGHALVDARLYNRAGYLDNPLEDPAFPKAILQDKRSLSDCDVFSAQVRAAGYDLFVARSVCLTHDDVPGKVMPLLDGKRLPFTHRALGVRQAYVDLLGREPDASGFWHYHNCSDSILQIRRNIAASDEAREFAALIGNVRH